LRSVQEPFTDLRARFAEYADQSGHPLDPARIKYYRVLGEAKILAMNHGTNLRDRAAAEGGGNDAGARLIFGQLHRRLCVEALADVLGISLPPYALPPEPARTDIDDLFDIVLSQLRHVVTPRITDSFALQRTKGLARVLKYLAESTRRSGDLDAQELDEVAALLGARPSSTAAARRDLAAAWRDGRLDAGQVIPALYRGIQRDNELLRGASGALADRHYDSVD